MDDAGVNVVADARTKWGKVKFGDGRLPAMALAIPLGIVLGFAAGIGLGAAGLTGPLPIVGPVVFGFCLSPPFIGAVYVLVVDRETIRGAASRPEESIEQTWFDKAAMKTLCDVVVVAGLGSVAVGFADLQLPTNLVLIGVVALAFISFPIRYALMKRRG